MLSDFCCGNKTRAAIWTTGSLQLLGGKMWMDLLQTWLVILFSHLKPLVHSFCSPRSGQFASLSLATCSGCWSSNPPTSPSSNARFAVTYKDRRETLEDFSTRSRGYAMRKRCRVQLLTTLSLLFISVICMSRAGELCCYTARGRKRLFNDHAGLL